MEEAENVNADENKPNKTNLRNKKKYSYSLNIADVNALYLVYCYYKADQFNQ